MPILLGYFDQKYPPSTQTSAGDFIKAIITISANASQNEQSCIGPNNLTRQLVSEPCIEKLISDMLRGGNPLTVGVGTIIEVIRKNNSDYDLNVGTEAESVPSGGDPIYLGTLLRHFAKHVPDFMDLILSPTHTVLDGDKTVTVKRKELAVAFGSKIEPLGFDRFKTCELMAELLHCSNMRLLNERGSEAYVKQRDKERDPLRAEGSFEASRPPTSAITEFSEDSVSFRNGVSPLGIGTGSRNLNEARRLEVANIVDEDGFEDVGTSADLADEVKDDFDEKPPFELESEPVESPTTRTEGKPRLDLDDDFVDELLTSPRLEYFDDKDEELLDDFGATDALEPEPLSPTFGLRSQIEGLALKGPLSTDDYQSTVNTNASANVTHSGVRTPTSDAPPLPHRERFLEPDPSHSFENDDDRDLSPHPDDKPQPLFANRSEPSTDHAPRPDDQDMAGGDNSQETIDSAFGEEGDSIRSVLMSGNDQEFLPRIENDVDGQPIVGDFLKMMFVEHKVVPTILVRHFTTFWERRHFANIFIIKGLFLSIPLE